MKSRFSMDWDCGELARAFKVKEEDIEEYLTDGRRASFIIERRLVWEHPRWELAPTEGAGYDLKAPDGGLWEVRSITKGGVYFNPSAQVGSGRTFNEAGFLAKLDQIEGFILADIVTFPTVTLFKISKDFISKCYRDSVLNASAKISRAKFYREMEPKIPVA